MPTIIDYKGIQILSSVSGDGGILIQNALKELAARVGPTYSTTTNPTISDDGSGNSTSGKTFEIGSRWINTSTGSELVCLDNSTGAAVWTSTTYTPTLNSLLPTQTSNSGKFLTTDGSSSSWASVIVPTAANPTGLVGTTAVNGTASTFMRSDAAPRLDPSSTPTFAGLTVNGQANIGAVSSPYYISQTGTVVIGDTTQVIGSGGVDVALPLYMRPGLQINFNGTGVMAYNGGASVLERNGSEILIANNGFWSYLTSFARLRYAVPASAPTLTANGQVSAWIDESGSPSLLSFAGRDSAGTSRTAMGIGARTATLGVPSLDIPYVLRLIGCDTTAGPTLAMRQNSDQNYGFDFDLETITAGRFDILRVYGGTRTPVISVFRDSNHVSIGTTANNGRDILQANGSVSATTYYGDGSHLSGITVPTAADSAGSVGMTRSVGTASTYKRSDAVDPIDQAIAPTWTGLHTFNSGVVVGDNQYISSTNPGNAAGPGLTARIYAWGSTYTLKYQSNGGLGSYISVSGVPVIGFQNSGSPMLPSNGSLTWCTISSLNTGPDSGISKLAAKKFGFGSATNGDVTGTIVAASMGLGVSTPLSALDVNGGVAVGSYAGANAAPSNGLIVSGSVGIGTNGPAGQLEVTNAGTVLLSVGGGNPTNGVYTRYFTTDNFFAMYDTAAHAKSPGTAGRLLYCDFTRINTVGTIGFAPNNGTDVYSNADVGFARVSAGLAKVTNGSSGYGTLDAAGYKVSGTAGVSGTATSANTLTIVGGIITNIA